MRIPSLAEIHAQRGVRGYRAVSTFSGCGGACLGLTWAGFNVVWASEFISIAAETYRLNHPDTILDTNDIRNVKADDILQQIGGDVGQLELLEGSPPCASFSTSGARTKHWGEVKKYSDGAQRTDDLFFEYVRLVDGIQPKAFIAENVTGLAKGAAKGYLRQIVQAMRDVGYRVEVWKLSAQYLGVAQLRPRIVFVGVRSDLSGFPDRPVPQPETTLRQAIEDLRDDLTWRSANHKGEDMPSERHRPTVDHYSTGRKGKNLAQGEQHPQRFNLIRAHWDRPLPTLTQTGGNISAAGILHPDGPWKFSIAELKRLSGFPDDFKLIGSYMERVERLGRAVVPPMYLAVGEKIADWLDEQETT